MNYRQTGHIYLIGFSGSGKTTVGPILARRLKLGYHDTDSIIEKRVGRSTKQIFSDKGERHFRKLETETIKSLAAKSKVAVIALGGGALSSVGNLKLIKSSGRLIYLSCSIRELCKRLRNKDDRPMLDGKKSLQEQVTKLLNKRRNDYVSADIIVSTTNRTPAQAAAIIAAKLK